MDNPHVAILITSAKGAVLSIHGAASDLSWLARPGAGAPGTGVLAAGFELRQPSGESVPESDGPLARALRGEYFTGLEWHVAQPASGRYWIGSWSAAPVHDAAGALTAIVFSVQDLTSHRRAQLASDRWKLLSLHSRDVILFIDPENGRILEANATAERCYGYTRNELLRMSVADLRTPETREAAAGQMAHANAQSIQFETTHRRKDGTVFPVEVSSRGSRRGSGSILISIVRDITERKRAEEDRARNEAKLKAVFHALVEGVIFLNRTGIVEELNQAVRRIQGQTIEELTAPDRGSHYEMIRGDGSPLAEQDQPAMVALRTGEPVRDFELGVRDRDGRVRWRLVNAQPVRDDAGQLLGVVASFFDITARKEAEIALEGARVALREHAQNLEATVRKRTAELQDLVAELEHFSYSITHDLRAPLRAMRGYAEILNESLAGSSNPEVPVFLSRIMRAAERMDLLITDALSYSRAVRQELPVAVVDVGGLVQGMLDTYAEFQPSRATIDLAPDLPRVLGNEAGLTQCFSNLLGNAVKFVPKGRRPEVRVWAEFVERSGTSASPFAAPAAASIQPAAKIDASAGRWVRIWVEDHGIGIPENMRPRIFDMFSRVNRDYEGTGIGLALVRKVVQRMGGKVGVESELGRGSRFWIELRPAGKPSDA